MSPALTGGFFLPLSHQRSPVFILYQIFILYKLIPHNVYSGLNVSIIQIQASLLCGLENKIEKKENISYTTKTNRLKKSHIILY